MKTELLNALLITFFVTTFELHPLCQLTRRAYDNTRINGSCCCESTAAEYNLQQLRIQISLNFWKRSRVHVFVNQSRCLYKREHRGFYLSRVDTWSFFFHVSHRAFRHSQESTLDVVASSSSCSFGKHLKPQAQEPRAPKAHCSCACAF